VGGPLTFFLKGGGGKWFECAVIPITFAVSLCCVECYEWHCCDLFVAFLLVGNMASEWHVAEKQITSAYRAFSSEKIVGDLGVYIGFNHVNVSLRCEFGLIRSMVGSCHLIAFLPQPEHSTIPPAKSITTNDSPGKDPAI